MRGGGGVFDGAGAVEIREGVGSGFVGSWKLGMEGREEVRRRRRGGGERAASGRAGAKKARARLGQAARVLAAPGADLLAQAHDALQLARGPAYAKGAADGLHGGDAQLQLAGGHLHGHVPQLLVV